MQHNRLPALQTLSEKSNFSREELLDLLYLFEKYPHTQMLASYLIQQIKCLDHSTIDELKELLSKIQRWKWEESEIVTISSSVTGDSFRRILEKTADVITNAICLKEDLTNTLTNNFIMVETQSQTQQPITYDHLLGLIKSGEINNDQYELLIIYLHEFPLKQLNVIVDLLIQYPITTTIIFTLFDINKEIFSSVSRYLKSKKTPEEMVVKVIYSNIIIPELCELIKAGYATKNFTLDLGSTLSEEAAKEVAAVLQSEISLPGFYLHVKNRNAKIIIDSLEYCKIQGLRVLFDDEEVDVDMQKYLIKKINKNFPEDLGLHISTNTDAINNDLGKDIASLITENRYPKDLQLITDCSGIIDQYIGYLINAFDQGRPTTSLNLGFARSSIVSSASKMDFVSMLRNLTMPQGVSFDIEFLLVNDLDFQVAMAKVLKINTSIIIPSIQNLNENEYYKNIEICSLRNRLLLKYPEHVDYIKRKSIQAGIYDPVKDRVSPISLKTFAAVTLFNKVKDYDKLISSQPQEIIEFFNKFLTVYNNFIHVQQVVS